MITRAPKISPNSLKARGVELPPLRGATAPAVGGPPTGDGVGLMPSMRRIIKPEAQARWLLPSLAAITPIYIETILRGALSGNHLQQWQLFDLMEDTWARLSKNLNQIKRAVVQMDWKLKPYAEENETPTPEAIERARVVSHAVHTMRPNRAADENGFEETIYDVLDAWAKGTSVLEIEWESRAAGKLGQIVGPRCTVWAHPKNYAWNGEVGYLGLVTQQITPIQPTTNVYVQPFIDDKFLAAVCKAKSGHILASALLRPLAWWWCAANFSADWLLNYAQVFGLPMRWANYDRNAPDETIDRICLMLERMGSAGWAAFPDGTTMELKEASHSGDALPQGNIMDRADTQVDLLILGQTLTSEVRKVGSLALGEVHEGVLTENKQSAADFAAGVINDQLVPAILRLNFGPAGGDEMAPKFCPEPKKVEDKQALATTHKTLLDAGILMPAKWLYAQHGIPMPAPGEEVIGEKVEVDPEIDDPNGQNNGGQNNSGKKNLKGRASDIRARGDSRPTGQLEETTAHDFGGAIADALRHPVEDLAKILAITDPVVMETELRAFLADFPALQAAIGNSTAPARVLANSMSSALAKGFNEK